MRFVPEANIEGEVGEGEVVEREGELIWENKSEMDERPLSSSLILAGIAGLRRQCLKV
jgi:hypothetical protein